ncbi:SARP family transcriptional regulator [Planotetraspora silvatica]|uniref:SARP family transcriptional regulator n=1 Tax=Planotetraspora silvatica TaxID=234614 RepID=A0A8J3UF05_9ACTN|nr:BTAD domain-containing putative transcriptional regulator [Planotetraspora silvatica]GII43667.1 SARP family transcriptional regulator [Planotetraspora silvatica]
MEYRLLGPVRVRDDTGREIHVVRPKHRQVLVALLVAGGRVVPADRLVEHLWDGTPPASARGNLKTYVSDLRRLLSPSGEASPIETAGDGYRLAVRPGELDLGAFTDLAARGRAALKSGEGARAEALFQRALLLWRDDPFQDVPMTLALEQVATELREERLSVFEDWAEARLDLGMHAEMISPLRAWVRDHPLRERPWGELMLALSRDGRRADALAAFQELRRRLVEDLGVEPAHSIQRLHQRILAADPDLILASPYGPSGSGRGAPATDDVPAGTDDGSRTGGPAAGRDDAASPPPAVPRQLPSDVPHFVGREQELTRLTSWLAPPDGSAPAPVVAICGPPGTGKSALALRAARRAMSLFPDGQVYVNLRGAMPGVRRLDTEELIGRLLRTFGMPEANLPPDADEAASALRTMLHDKRVLLLLDDAFSISQVEPLLPMTAGSTILLTSRESLARAAPGSHVNLGPLPRDEAVMMLVRRFRSGGVEHSEKAVERLAVLCDGFPLALHVAGARLAGRAGWSADMLIERLEDESRRLDELRSGEAGVRGSIAVSYTALAASGQAVEREAARAFRLIGLLRVPDVGLEVVAALLDTQPRIAEEIIERLFDARLVDGPVPDRYTMHDLIRLFAQERALEIEPAERIAALRRVLGFHLATTGAAVRLVEPHREHAAMPAVPQAPLALRGREDAERWLDRELPNLLSIAEQAWDADEGTARLALAIALNLRWHPAAHRYRNDMRALGAASVETARRLGDRVSESQALSMLSMAYRALNDDAAELDCLKAELELCRELGDGFGEMRALGNLASAHLLLERHDEALRFAEQQLVISRRVGSVAGERYALIMAGEAHTSLGTLAEAVAVLREALELSRETGDLMHEAMTLRRLGEADLARGDAAAARGRLRDAVTRFGECAQSLELSETLVALARSSRLLGDVDEASEQIAHAVRIARDTGDRNDERRALEEQARILGRG